MGTIYDAKRIIEEIVYTSRKEAKKYSEQIVELKLSGIEVTDYLSFLEQIEGKIDVNKIWIYLKALVMDIFQHIQELI